MSNKLYLLVYYCKNYNDSGKIVFYEIFVIYQNIIFKLFGFIKILRLIVVYSKQSESRFNCISCNLIINVYSFALIFNTYNNIDGKTKKVEFIGNFFSFSVNFLSPFLSKQLVNN